MRVWSEGLRRHGAVSCEGGNRDGKEGISMDREDVPWNYPSRPSLTRLSVVSSRSWVDILPNMHYYEPL